MQLKIAAIAALLLATVPVWAHHGMTGFDQNKPVHLVGKISMLDWANPHVVIHLDVTGTDGKAATWLVNTIPPNAVKYRGLSQSSFAIGTQITVDGYQAIDGSNHVNSTGIAFPDGKKLGGGPDCFAEPEKCYHSVK